MIKMYSLPARLYCFEVHWRVTGDSEALNTSYVQANESTSAQRSLKCWLQIGFGSPNPRHLAVIPTQGCVLCIAREGHLVSRDL